MLKYFKRKDNSCLISLAGRLFISLIYPKSRKPARNSFVGFPLSINKRRLLFRLTCQFDYKDVSFHSINSYPQWWGGGGYSDILYIQRLGCFFGVKILKFSIFWGFRKITIFGGSDFLRIFFLGSAH